MTWTVRSGLGVSTIGGRAARAMFTHQNYIHAASQTRPSQPDDLDSIKQHSARPGCSACHRHFVTTSQIRAGSSEGDRV